MLKSKLSATSDQQPAVSRQQSATAGGLLARARAMQVAAVTSQAILAHMTGRDRAHLIAHPEMTVDPHHAEEFVQLLERAAQGEPLAYLTGEREFCGLLFFVSPAVLIPRPETEMLVEAGVEWAQRRAQSHISIVDVGTGSGAIAVTLAVRLPQARLLAVDMSSEALTLARANARRHSVEERITFVQGDLMESLPGRYDCILANLPYIPGDSLKKLEVSRWEPALALDGGADGLDLIRRMVACAPAKLSPGGLLALEIQFDQGPAAAALCRDAFPDAQIDIRRDLAGLDRMATVITEC